VGHKWVTFSFLSAKNIIKKKKNIQQLFWLTTRVTVFQEEKKSLSCIEFFLLSSDSMTFQPDAHVFFLDVIACCVTKSALRFIARLNFHKQSAILFLFQLKIFFFFDFLWTFCTAPCDGSGKSGDHFQSRTELNSLNQSG
jgi:hypothetical protein